MTLDEAIKTFEAQFKKVCVHHAGEIPMHCVPKSNNRYDVVVSGGTKKEGQVIELEFSSPEAAIDAWFEAILAYKARFPAKVKTLWWRCYPVLEQDDRRSKPSKRALFGRKLKGQRYRVYSRLAVY